MLPACMPNATWFILPTFSEDNWYIAYNVTSLYLYVHPDALPVAMPQHSLICAHADHPMWRCRCLSHTVCQPGKTPARRCSTEAAQAPKTSGPSRMHQVRACPPVCACLLRALPGLNPPDIAEQQYHS